jgi:hypothetical protein
MRNRQIQRHVLSAYGLTIPAGRLILVKLSLLGCFYNDDEIRPQHYYGYPSAEQNLLTAKSSMA